MQKFRQMTDFHHWGSNSVMRGAGLREKGAWCCAPCSLQAHGVALPHKATMPFSIPSPLAGHCPCGFKAIKGAAATTRHATAPVSGVITNIGYALTCCLPGCKQAKRKAGQGVSLCCACTQEPLTLSHLLSASVTGLQVFHCGF